MTKDEIKEEIERLIDDEMSITNLQRDNYSPDRLNTLWEIIKLFD